VTKKKALGAAGTAAEGQNPEGINLMSKATRKARAAAAVPGTVAADRRIDIDERVDPRGEVLSREERAALPQARLRRLVEQEFAHLPLRVRNTTQGRRVRIWRSVDGRWWRLGGAIRIQRWPVEGGERAFVVTLFKGANEDDLQVLLRAVEKARTGAGFEALWSPLEADWADDLTFSYRWARAYDDPFTHSDPARDVAACTDALCVDRWHDECGRHHLDEVVKELPDGAGRYRIVVGKDFDDNGRGWIVDVYTDEFYGSAADVASFVSDLQWMQAVAEKANERERLAEGVPVDWSASPSVGAVA
jgi:hypothetical protein